MIPFSSKAIGSPWGSVQKKVPIMPGSNPHKEGGVSQEPRTEVWQDAGHCQHTSLGACTSTNSSKILWALETSFAVDLVFLNSSQANQNSRFSSLNSVFRKARNAATPSADVEGDGKEEIGRSLSSRTVEEREKGSNNIRLALAKPPLLLHILLKTLCP